MRITTRLKWRQPAGYDVFKKNKYIHMAKSLAMIPARLRKPFKISSSCMQDLQGKPVIQRNI